MRSQTPRYDHLLSLIDDTGIFEHARYGIPRREHGYTLDDAARAVVVLCQAADEPERRRALHVVLSFVINAQRPDGRFHNRLSHDRRWRDRVGSDDAGGRAMWALGVAASCAPLPEWRSAARSVLEEARLPRSSHLRPPAFAALGAYAVWQDRPDDRLAFTIMEEVADRFEALTRPWPEPRLTYANGRLPHAMLAIGEALHRTEMITSGLDALEWLDKVETRGAHYSFTPVGGWAPGETRPGFDQQPVECAAMASAAEHAWRLTGDRRWRDAVMRAGRWLDGQNDSETPLFDAVTGACRDGLTRTGANQNLGAESTLAGLEVKQACARVNSSVSPGATGPATAVEYGR